MIDRAAWTQARQTQQILLQQYRQLVGISLDDVGWSAQSQNDEDGLLLYVFAHVGFKTRIAIEIAAGDGIECNSANLLLHHGFTGLLFEGHPDKRAAGEAFYATHPATSFFPPRWVGDWVTRENINTLIADHMFHGVLADGGEIDLLSLDIDGNDYWVLEALFCVRPRVIILEFNALWGATRACTIPYDPDFRAELGPVHIFYMGASLMAFVKLLAKRDYRLVGIERLGINAVFVRNDLAADTLPAIEATACMARPIIRICQAQLAAEPQLGADVRARVWVDV